MEPAGRPRDRVPRIDPYGFERPEDFDYAAYEEFFSAYLVILTRRAMKWSKLLKGGGGVQKSGTVKRYIRKGVPLEHRAHVWMGVSGAQARMDQNPGYYHRLLQGECSGRLEEAIWTDMNRTFPDNVKFRKSADPCLQKTLYNVLVAYGRHNQGVGYCQGMNFIAGYLVLITKSEEKSFWLLDALVGRILPDYYSPAMLGLKTDQEVLGELVRTKLPAVAALMDRHGVLWTLVVSRWFICLFVDVLPVEVSAAYASWGPGPCEPPAGDAPFLSADGAPDLGLSVQRRLEDSLPGGPDPDQAPPGLYFGSQQCGGHLRAVQGDHQRQLCDRVPHLHAENIFRARELVHGHHHQASRELQG